MKSASGFPICFRSTKGRVYLLIQMLNEPTVLSFFQRFRMGPSSLAQTSLSNFEAFVSARFRILSCVITALLAILCEDLSIFSGRPKYDGLSDSGKASIASM